MTANSQVKVWFDGAFKASAEEIELVKARDRNQQLQFIDASAGDFKPEGEVTADFVRKSVAARDASGTVKKGIAALEAVYEAMGLGSYFRFCRKPGLESGRPFEEAASEPATPELKQAA